MSNKVFYRLSVTETGINMETVNTSDLDASVKHYDVIDSSNYTKILNMYETVALSNPDYVAYIMDYIRNNSYTMINEYTDFIRELKVKGVRTVPSLEEYIVTYDQLRTESLAMFNRDLISEFDYIKQVVTGAQSIDTLIKSAAYNEAGIPLDQETSTRLFNLSEAASSLVSTYLDRITDLINPLDNNLLTLSLSEQIIPYRNAIFVTLNDTIMVTEAVVNNFLTYGPVIPASAHTSVTVLPIPSTTLTLTPVPMSGDHIDVADDAGLTGYVPTASEIGLANIADGTNPAGNPVSYLNHGTVIYTRDGITVST